MKKRMMIGVLLGIGLAALTSLLRTSVSWVDVIKQPIQSLWGSPAQLTSTVLEVTENIDTVEAATRSILKPFGVVRLVRRFAPSDTSH